MTLAAPPAVPLTTSLQPIYTNTSGNNQLVRVRFPNVNTANPVTVTANWLDATGNPVNVAAPICVVDIPLKDGYVTEDIVLAPGDAIQAMASAVGYVTATVAVLWEE